MDSHPDNKREPVSVSRKSLIIGIVCAIFTLVFACYITFYFTKVNYDKSVPISPLVISSSPSAADLRLPTALQPLSYDLQIKVYLPGYVSFDSHFNLTYEGQVEMEIEVKQAVRKIVLNMKNISIIEEKTELHMDGKNIDIGSIMLHEELEKISFNLGMPLKKGSKIILKVYFNGDICNTLGGLYQTKYTQADGSQKIAAVTQMEPTYARRMVPCFDEPEYKANWTVTVIHPKGTTALSNGFEQESSKLDDNWTISKFETTPKMSSYLLAIMVSEFDFNELNTESGIRFRVWSRPEAMNLTKYALEAGVKCLEYYEKYFGIKYPLKKQDMIALPDFGANAMENWGLITFRESALLYNDKIYSLEGRRVVASVVAHELAHQVR